MLLLAGLVLAQFARAGVSVTDDYGNVVSLPRPAVRIVSLAPHLTEILYAAGAGSRLVGALEPADYPEEARKLRRVGNDAGINVEAVVALKPDLVAAWPNAGSARQVERLASLGIPVYRSEPRALDDVARTLLAMGTLAGTPAAAQAAADAFRARVRELEAKYATRPPVRVFYQVWDRPIVTVNGEHLISKVMRLCGAVNVFADLPVLAPAIDREAVLRADPEAIVASGADERPPAWLQDWKAFAGLSAAARGNLFAIPPQLMQRHAPRILEAAERLCHAMEQVRARRKG